MTFLDGRRKAIALTLLVALTTTANARAETARPTKTARADAKRRTKGAHKKKHTDDEANAAPVVTKRRGEHASAPVADNPAERADEPTASEVAEHKGGSHAAEAESDSPTRSKTKLDFGQQKDRSAEDRPASREAAEHPITVAPLFGYSAGGFGIGLGARAGYTLPTGSKPGTGLYVGGSFIYHFGFSAGSALIRSSVDFSAYYPSAEVGYDIRPVDRLTVRPYGGAAVVVGSVTASGLFSGGSTSGPAFGLYPGCAVTYDIPSTPAFVGGDARLLIVFGGLTSFASFATGGIRF